MFVSPVRGWATFFDLTLTPMQRCGISYMNNTYDALRENYLYLLNLSCVFIMTIRLPYMFVVTRQLHFLLGSSWWYLLYSAWSEEIKFAH